MTSIVQLSDVHKSYRRGAEDTHVLRGINLTVRRGECVILAGPSGSGKSTLLSVLGCLLTADKGRVSLMGAQLDQLTSRQRTRLRRDEIGFVFQRFQLIRGLTAAQNINVPLTLQGTSPAAGRARVNKLIEAVGLTAQANKLPDNMSSGQCQRVAIARALANDPELILADEPTASLDAENGEQIMRLFRDLLHRYQKTAIVVTHDQRVFPYADRICWLNNGVLSADQASLAPHSTAPPNRNLSLIGTNHD